MIITKFGNLLVWDHPNLLPEIKYFTKYFGIGYFAVLTPVDKGTIVYIQFLHYLLASIYKSVPFYLLIRR